MTIVTGIFEGKPWLSDIYRKGCRALSDTASCMATPELGADQGEAVLIVQPAVARAARRPLYRQLYAQVLVAVVAGVLVGHFAPDTGAALKPLGDAFIKLVKMVVAPVIFLTVATGIGGMNQLGTVGRVFGKAWRTAMSGRRRPILTDRRRTRATPTSSASTVPIIS
jgi:hypothetical protein